MIPVKEACEPECPGMHRPIFRKTEVDRAEKILSALDGLDRDRHIHAWLCRH